MGKADLFLRNAITNGEERTSLIGSIHDQCDETKILLQVYNGGHMPSTTPGVFLGYRVNQSGLEYEGQIADGVADISVGIPFTVFGALPVVGDQLVAHRLNGRWVARKKGTPPSTVITLPGCPCLVPPSLQMSVIRPDANFGIFQNCTLSWQPVPPALSLLSLGLKSYISDIQLVDQVTLDSFWYHFFCAGGYFCLSRIYAISVYGSPFSDAIRYRWIGGQPGNTCVPFLMSNGRIFPGGDPTSVVTLSE